MAINKLYRPILDFGENKWYKYIIQTIHLGQDKTHNTYVQNVTL